MDSSAPSISPRITSGSFYTSYYFFFKLMAGMPLLFYRNFIRSNISDGITRGSGKVKSRLNFGLLNISIDASNFFLSTLKSIA